MQELSRRQGSSNQTQIKMEMEAQIQSHSYSSSNMSMSIDTPSMSIPFPFRFPYIVAITSTHSITITPFRLIIFVFTLMLLCLWSFMNLFHHNDDLTIHLHFSTCGGFTNQRISIMYGLVLGHIMESEVHLPNLHSSFKKELSELIPFKEIYDLNSLKNKLNDIVKFHSNEKHTHDYSDNKYTVCQVDLRKALGDVHRSRLSSPSWDTMASMAYKKSIRKLMIQSCPPSYIHFNSHGGINDNDNPFDHGDDDTGKSLHIDVGCPFLGFHMNNDDQLSDLAWRVESSLELTGSLMSASHDVLAAMRAMTGNSREGQFVAFHLRYEKDWQKHCKEWSVIKDNRPRNNCETNNQLLAEVFSERKIPRNIPIYLAGGPYSDEFIHSNDGPLHKLVKYYKFVTKNDLLGKINLSNSFHEHTMDLNDSKSIKRYRELFAAIDFEVASKADLFIGNSVSTFSAILEMKRRRLLMPTWHYNGGNIPLAENIRPVTRSFRAVAQAGELTWDRRQQYILTQSDSLGEGIYKRSGDLRGTAYVSSSSDNNMISTVDAFGPLKWVFTLYFSESMDESFLLMAKVAVLSARLKTHLMPYCLYSVDHEYTLKNPIVIDMLRWLQNAGVFLIRHEPLWKDFIVQLFASSHNNSNDNKQNMDLTSIKSVLKKNKMFSPLYETSHSLISTFLRIDIPLVMSKEQFVLYTGKLNSVV
jgi:hypothetical protein